MWNTTDWCSVGATWKAQGSITSISWWRRMGPGSSNAETATPHRRMTPSNAVKKPDASGKSTNALEVRVMADHIEYVVNGTIVHTTPKTGLTAKTDGIFGIRVNHHLEVHVDGF